MRWSPGGQSRRWQRLLLRGTLDWLEQRVLRTEQHGRGARYNYELYNPGFQTTPVWGGAAFLQRLVNHASRERNKRPEADGTSITLSVAPIELPDPNSAEARQFVESLASIGPTAPETKGAGKNSIPVRVEAFKGFSANGYGTTRPRVMTIKALARTG